MARITHKDIDFVQIYDDYTIAVIMQLEDSGFCKKGQGGKFVEENDISFKGDLPLNTGGGQLSSGQPAMAGGLVHIVEAIRQIRGKGDKRQVQNAEVGLVTGIGGISYGNSLANSMTVILGR
jgi:acetyl-CoA C-acetyltransferase